ncbi:uncharacterized protein LOC143625300 [Bidens hawaiensis]|uniref:uncharacterized protein LOC143625300 n=1 Tax=Bidens hawaiensis TaxID=980011 RepID=UPI004049705A
MMRSDRKPPLALRSPIRLRPRRGVQSTVNNVQTKSVSMTKARLPKQSSNSEEQEMNSERQKISFSMTKSRLPKQFSTSEEHELRPEYQTISCELKDLMKMVQENLWRPATKNQSANAHNNNPVLQRGRLYDEYSARRNERLKRKRGEPETKNKTPPSKLYVGGRIESAKEVKKNESGRKMATPAAATTATTTRYSLRSSCKENNKPPLAMRFERSSIEKTTAVRRTARKGAVKICMVRRFWPTSYGLNLEVGALTALANSGDITVEWAFSIALAMSFERSSMEKKS